MKLSVVTPTHDKLELLRRTLASLEGQDLDPGSFEVVVVDDGSTDDTPRFLEGHRPGFPLRTVRLDTNAGRAAARNRGLERAAGDLVVFLDDDMEVVPGFLRAHLELHESGGAVAGIGNVVNHPEVTMAPIDRYMSTRGAQKIRDRGPLPWKYFSTNNASVKRADLDAVGGFDEGFVWYGFEDLELAWRLVRDRGITLRFVPDARSLHIHPHTLDEVLDKKTLCGRSSMPYLFRKHPETRVELGYHRYDPPSAGDPPGLNLVRWMHGVLLTPWVYALVRPLATRSLGEVTNRAIDYLVLYHYLLGLKGSGNYPTGRPRAASSTGRGGAS